jgi:tetratricopeptide (TPR) repeat protein
VLGQSNNLLKGVILYQNSNKKPAIGVQISASIIISDTIENTNQKYTNDSGEYELIFANSRPGHSVKLLIGTTDRYDEVIEVVNNTEVDICRIPAIASTIFKIIVCPKGSRDLAAERYYKIIKSSSRKALNEKQKQLDILLKEREIDYNKITALTNKIARLRQQADTLAIYKEAYRIASINKDDASDRMKKYIQLLDEGVSIQEAREALNVGEATKQVGNSLSQIETAIKELETHAKASKALYHFHTVLTCYDIIIYHLEMMEDYANPEKTADYSLKAANALYQNGYHKIALNYQLKALKLLSSKSPKRELVYNHLALTYHKLGKYKNALECNLKAVNIGKAINSPNLANTYHTITSTYQYLGQYEIALEYNIKGRNVQETLLDSNLTNLIYAYRNTAKTYQYLGQYETALKYNLKEIKTQRARLDSNQLDFSYTYNNIAKTYQHLGQYEMALKYNLKALKTQESKLRPQHPSLAISYNNIATTYQLLERHHTSLQYSIKAVKFQEATLKPNHPDLATSYYNIASNYQQIKQFDNALTYQLKSLKIIETILPDNYILKQKNIQALAEIYNSKGFIAYQKKDYNNAIQLYQEAVVIFPEFKNQIYHNNIGLAYAKNKQYKEAFIAFRAYEKLFPTEGKTYRNWAMFYALKNKRSRAISYLQKAIDLGYCNLQWLKKDNSINKLRNEQKVIDLIQQLEKK